MSVQSATSYAREHAAAVAGAIADGQLINVITGLAESAIPFGRFVAQGTAADEVDLPAAAADVTTNGIGFAILQQANVANASDVLEYKIGEDASIMDFGVCWVEVEDAVAKGGNVFIRHTGGNEGLARSDADGSDATQLPGAKFVSAAGAGELALVRFRP